MSTPPTPSSLSTALAAKISEYLITGHHHMTNLGQAAIAAIIDAQLNRKEAYDLMVALREAAGVQ
jgi:hypothetical protein